MVGKADKPMPEMVDTAIVSVGVPAVNDIVGKLMVGVEIVGRPVGILKLERYSEALAAPDNKLAVSS